MEREDNGSYMTEQGKDDPSWDSNHTHSAILVRLKETSNPRLASECIITDANSSMACLRNDATELHRQAVYSNLT
jgi:hypothetical protein